MLQAKKTISEVGVKNAITMQGEDTITKLESINTKDEAEEVEETD